MQKTYDTYRVIGDTQSDNLRSEKFWRRCGITGLALLFAGAAFAGLYNEPIWLYGGVVLFVVLFLGGLVRMDAILTHSQRFVSDEAREAARHEREIQMLSAQTSSKEQIIRANAHLEIVRADAAARIAAANNTVWNQKLTASGKDVPPALAAVPAIHVTAGGVEIRHELLDAIVTAWPTSRADLRERGVKFRNNEFGDAVAALREQLGEDAGAPKRMDLLAAAARIRNGIAPPGWVIKSLETQAGTGD